ncbi:uncharacterized protein LOC131052440 isoform X2 [Cryptomeria japonica]|uniref:uncharacterized protein LOC131052440 isoform X2 n=1 Tax=Cryptomeria japonica TaxID=3369 RepID=UPI0025ACC1A0|nr:uncharacterized protein LOC131052440 isoform X2 [Cryptomeria japonica]
MSGGQGASHSLAFRVMRLCRPSFQIDHPLVCDPLDLMLGEDFLDNESATPTSLSNLIVEDQSKEKESFWRRFELETPMDAMGLSGLLVLPQAFGAIYLGETFCSYISVGNHSSFEVRDVVIKAEIQTERQRLVLSDTSKSPIESIRAGGRYDFIIEHDIKELGPHTLVCMAVYIDADGERKHLPQFFKFVVANPLSVRTKVRSVKDSTFLEACIENHTKSHLYMDQVQFEPAQPWTAKVLTADDAKIDVDPQVRDIFKAPDLIRANGGIRNYIYQLTQSSSESTAVKVEGSNTLGKLQITWRTNLGEPGRLQTQNILGNPISHKEVDIQIVELPPHIILNRPFLVRARLLNHTDKRIGPLEVSLSQDESHGVKRAIVVNGLWTLNLVATSLGVQKISGIAVYDSREKKPYDSLPPIEVFVNPE